MGKIARFQMPDGRIGRFEVPDDATPEQAQELIKQSLGQPEQKNQGLSVPEVVKMAFNITPIGAAMQGAEQLDKLADQAGGKVTDIASKTGLSPEVSGGLGVATNIGVQAIPTVLGGSLAKAAAPILRSGAEKLMFGALNPTMKDRLTGKAARAAGTLLDEGMSPTTSGVEKLREVATAQNQEVADLIKKTGGTVDKGAAAGRIQDVITKVETTHPTPQEAIPAIEKVYTNFLNNGYIPKNIPVEQAQAIKQEIYRMSKYGELKGDAPREAAFKALGRGLKEELESSVPGVEALNARAGDLWNALNVSERRALADIGKSNLGLGAIAHSKIMFVAYLADKSTAFKALLARGLNAGKEQIPATVTRAGIAGYEASKE